jgi:PAS domain S-box-containing protein
MDQSAFDRQELQAALDAARETEARHRIIAETVSDALITIDENSTILFINPAAEKIFGHALAEMRGQPLAMLMPDYLRHLHQAGLNRYIETGQKHMSWQAVELPGLHKNGHQIPLELSFGEFTREGKRFFTGIVRDITDRRRGERRLNAQYAVTRELSESATLADAAPEILRAICVNLDYQVGALWHVDREADVLRCVETWHDPSMSETELEIISKRRTFERGVGFPGHVWADGAPVWVKDIVTKGHYPRASLAEKGNLHGAVAFPLLSGSEILGVMEFFTHEVRQPDEDLLKMMSAVGRQIGLFIERRRAELALKASEQRYRYLTDAMPQIVWTAQPDGHADYFNRRWFEYTGLTMEQTLGLDWQPVLHPDDVASCLERWAKAVETGEAYEIEYRFRRSSDGRYRWHLGRAVPMRNESGEIVKWFGTCTDIDDHKQAEDALRFIAEASEMLASSLDYETTLGNLARLSVPRLADWCVVHIVEEDGSLQQLAAAHADESKIAVLKELRQLYPSSPDVAHGYPLVVRTGKPELIHEITDSLLTEFSRDEKHLELLRSLGLKSTLCVPLVARGRILGAIAFATAESGRLYDSASLKLAEDLAHRAASAVDNARLYKEARQSNRTKEDFLATLSHELRTPLTPIIGWVHMIRQRMLEADDLEHGLAIVEKNSQSLARLINDLLDMSAILSGKMRIEKVPVSIDEALREAVETIRPLAETRNINLEVRYCEGQRVIVNGDRTRLVQIFWNIMANSVKFSDTGGSVRVTCEADEREVSAIITDEGQGIAPEFLPQIFERFSQADSSKTRAHGGLGIGLALVKSFTEAHGGSVMVESAGPGRGSRFTVRLPRLTSPLKPAESVPTPVARPSGSEKASLLVVEDSPDTLEMLSRTLRLRGYWVTPCESAAEALSAARTAAFDLIISDIGMPEVDGYELIGRLRQIHGLSAVPAIALSGYAAKQDIASALAAGFDAHLAKPVDPDDLITQIEELLQRKTD